MSSNNSTNNEHIERRDAALSAEVWRQDAKAAKAARRERGQARRDAMVANREAASGQPIERARPAPLAPSTIAQQTRDAGGAARQAMIEQRRNAAAVK